MKRNDNGATLTPVMPWLWFFGYALLILAKQHEKNFPDETRENHSDRFTQVGWPDYDFHRYLPHHLTLDVQIGPTCGDCINFHEEDAFSAIQLHCSSSFGLRDSQLPPLTTNVIAQIQFGQAHASS